MVTTKDVLAARSGLVRRADRAPAGPLRIARSASSSASWPSTPSWASRWQHAPRYLKVEAYYGVSHEGALHLDDILARRLRVSVDTWDRGVDVAHEVAEMVAPVLGWDGATIERRGRALPAAGRRRTRLAAPARRQDGRLRTARRPRGPGRSRVSTT